MSLTVDFTASQTIGIPGTIGLTDISTGSDGTITKRRVYLTKTDSLTLVPTGTSTAYVLWSGFPGTTTISIAALDKDYCLSIRVDWLTAGDVVTYTKTHVVMVSMFDDTFKYTLTQAQTSNPDLLASKNYYNNKIVLMVEIDSAAQATSFASDQFSAQACLNRATRLRLNPQLFL